MARHVSQGVPRVGGNVLGNRDRGERVVESEGSTRG